MSTEGQHAPTQVSAQHGVDRYDDLDAVRALVDETIAALKLPDDYVRPGDRVVLKPNWVKEHDERPVGTRSHSPGGHRGGHSLGGRAVEWCWVDYCL